MDYRADTAGSQVMGIILVVVITLILALILFLMCLAFPMPSCEQEVPVIFEITQLGRDDPYGHNYDDSYLVLVNKGQIAYDNRKLRIKTYENGQLLPVIIPTVNGYDFINVYKHPYFIQTLGGTGSGNYYWYTNYPVEIDYQMGTFHKGGIVKIEVYDKTTDQIISRDTWPHNTTHNAQWFYRRFISHQGA
jgi:hypothetical protein